MKHQTITLLKFKSLAARLKLPLWQAVGILESLWLFAMHNARGGDLSRFRPTDIAAWLEYKGNAEGLVEALVENCWLDRDGKVLVIHDWGDHKPTWLKGVEARQLSSQVSSELSEQLSSPLSTQLSSGTKQVRVRVRVTGTGTSKGNKPKKGNARATRFVKPSIAEIDAYCKERGNGIDPQDFIDHYEANGWVCGRNRTPMRDWKAAIRTWEALRRKEKPESRVATPEDVAHFDLINGQPR